MDKTDSKAVRAAEGARDIGAVVRKKLWCPQFWTHVAAAGAGPNSRPSTIRLCGFAILTSPLMAHISVRWSSLARRHFPTTQTPERLSRNAAGCLGMEKMGSMDYPPDDYPRSWVAGARRSRWALEPDSATAS